MRKLVTTILAVALFGLGQAWAEQQTPAQQQPAGGASAGAGQAEVGAGLALSQGAVFTVFTASALVVSASGRSSPTTQH
jgi:hypothetical protein